MEFAEKRFWLHKKGNETRETKQKKHTQIWEIAKRFQFRKPKFKMLILTQIET